MSEDPTSLKLCDPRWQQRRLEIMKNAACMCQGCGAADKALNVQHLFKHAGFEPWDYPDAELLCVCDDCWDDRRLVSSATLRSATAGHRAPVLVMESIEEVERQYESRGGVTGLATGFSGFDRLTGGLQKMDMVVVAARPGMGKSSLGLNIATHVAIDQKKPVAIFSMGMSGRQVMSRLLCSRARINPLKMRSGYLTEGDFPNLTLAASEFADSRLYIEDTTPLSISNLQSRARHFHSRYKIELIVIDSLQQLRAGGRRHTSSRSIEVAKITRNVKDLAKELDLPILVLAQLNRRPEARVGGRPTMADLRESGSIEEEADLVVLLTRPEVYEEDEHARAEATGDAKLIIAKQPNGPVGEVMLTFLKEFTRFEDRP